MSAAQKQKTGSPVWRRVLTGIAIFLVVLALLVTAAFYSDTVFRQVVSLAEPLIPGDLQYEQINGTLAGPVEISGLNYEIADTHITADQFGFDLAPFALLGGNVQLQDVQARELVVRLAESGQDQQAGEPTSPEDIINALQLPVAISADSIIVNGFELQDAQGQVLFELRHLDAALEWNEQHLQIASLQAGGPLLDANGGVQLGLSRQAATDVQLDVAWRGQAFPVSGQLRAQGTAAEMELNARFREPANASLDATLSDLLDTPRWQGTLQIEQLQPSQIRETLPSETWSGTINFNGSWENTNVQAQLEGGWPPASGISLDLAADVNAERVLVQQLEAQVDAFGAELSAEGELHYADGLRYSAKGTVNQFNWPDIENLGVRDAQFDVSGNEEQLRGTVIATAEGEARGQLSVNGSLRYDDLHFDGEVGAQDFQVSFNQVQIDLATLAATASGTPQDYAANAEARVQVNELPPADVEVHVEGSTEQLSAQVEQLQWLNGSAQGNVQLAWQEAMRVNAELRGQGFELAQLDPQLNGTVGGDVSATANLAGEQPDVQVEINSLTGNIAGTELDGSGSIRLADGQLSTRGLDIRAGGGNLHLEGAEGAGFDFSLQAPALGRFHPELSGAIEATGHFEGDLQAPTFDVQATGRNVGWRDWQAGSFEVDGELGDGGEQNLSVDVQAQNLETPITQAENARIDIKGDLASHSIDVSLRRAGTDGEGEVVLAARGGIEDQQWQGSIGQLRFHHPATGTWSLQDARSKQITLAADNINVPSFCLEGPQGQACLGSFDMSGGEWHAQSQLQEIPVAVIAGFLPEGLDFRGAVSGQFDVSGGADGLEGQAEFTLSEGGIRQVAGEGGETLLGWESGRATANFNGRVADAELNIDLQDGGRVQGSGRLRAPESGAMTIDAGVQASIDNLQIVPSLVPELSRLQGRLTADLDINGPLAAPRIIGRARLHDGRARILALGTTWTNVNIELVGEGRDISLSGHAESGAGHIDVALEARESQDGFVGTARITGDDFEAIATPEAKAMISPQLDIELDGRDLYIDGDVRVPFARIEPRDFTGGVQPSEDQVIVNTEQAAAEEGLRLHAAVTTHLGEDVRVDAFGLTARLEGKLTVSKAPDQRPIGNGRLVIAEGDYQAYGQDLTLTKGEIIYSGQPLTNPGLDIRAERTIEPDTVAGVTVRGPLSQPTVSVYSDPPMPDTAAMSYLLFGRSLEEVTGEEESQVTSASLAMNLGGKKLLGRVGEKLGVEEVRIDRASSPEHASLVFGTYLSPDLYVSYGVGLYEAVNSFQIRYRLSSKWTLEAASGLSSSADFLYTIER